MIDKELFMNFALDSTKTMTEDGQIFKTIQNGITYVMYGDIAGKRLLNNYSSKVETLGFVYGGKFYSCYYTTHDYDLDLRTELDAFEDKFNAAYKEAKSHFSIENPVPVTERTKITYQNRAEDFEYYKRYSAWQDAKEELFEITHKKSETYHNNPLFADRFFDCLKNPEKFNTYVQAAIEENANDINYELKCKAEMLKKLEELKANSDLMRTLAIYKALEKLDGKTVKMTCNICGEMLVLSIERKKLMHNLAFNSYISSYNFVKSDEDRIRKALQADGKNVHNTDVAFSSIAKITYGKKVIFLAE